MTSHEIDDRLNQRATDYVLGELTGVDAIAFEKELQSSPELQAAVSSIREAVGALETEFAAETAAMSEADRAQVEAAMTQGKAAMTLGGTLSQRGATLAANDSPRSWVKLAVAASLLLVGGGFAMSAFWLHGNQGTMAKYEEVGTAIIEDGSAMNDDGSSELAMEREAASAEGSSQGGGGAASRSTSSRRRTTPRNLSTQAAAVPVSETESLRDERDLYRSDAMPTEVTQQAAQGRTTGKSEDAKSLPSYANYSSSNAKSDRGLSKGLSKDYLPPAAESAPAPVPASAKRPAPVDISGAVVNESILAEKSVVAGRGVRDRSRESKEFAEKQLGQMPRRVPSTGLSVVSPSVNLSAPGSSVNGPGGPGTNVELRKRPMVAVQDLSATIMERESSVEADDLFFAVPNAAETQSGDRFKSIHDNPFRNVAANPLSTFSIDVDTASYSKVRMYLMQHGRLPNPAAVRIEELVNYFDYNYEPPTDDRPFSAAMEVSSCPWNNKHRLARIGIKGKEFDSDRPSSNLVFLLDVSGSMNRSNKLPLVIDGMKELVENLTENDSVAIVVYAGAAGLVLDATPGDQKKTIIDSLERLKAGGSTAGAQGIQLAYDVARDHFIPGGTNRVILCSDGDFNVGVSNTDALVKLAEENAQSNIFLSVLGYGIGNHNDAMMEQVSNKANGNYAFIDSAAESHKVLVEQMQGTLVTIAKDVKIQIEFNPAAVRSYRLIGYENRILAAKDFDDDTKDAGEIGAGHTVTALYEIVPAGVGTDGAEATDGVQDLKYQKKVKLSKKADNGELLTLKLRYKPPTQSVSKLLEFPIKDDGKTFSQVDQDFQFAASVAAFGMLLRNSPHKGDANYDAVEELATAGAQGDLVGYRTEFVEMVKRAKATK